MLHQRRISPGLKNIKFIKWQTLAREYLTFELNRLLVIDVKKLSNILENLDDIELNRLLFSFSVIFRANGMHAMITNSDAKWILQKVKIEKTMLDGFHGLEITKLLRTKEIQNSPINLLKYLKNHKILSKKFPELLKIQSAEKSILFGRKLENGKIQIIDGAHRLLNFILHNRKTIDCYLLVNYVKKRELGKAKIPDSIFFWLKTMMTNLKFTEIEDLKGMMSVLGEKYFDSNNGVKKYLVDHISPKEAKENISQRALKIMPKSLKSKI